MVASRRTVADVGDVVLRHLSRPAALALLDELATMGGNASFVQTVELLRRAVASVQEPASPRDAYDLEGRERLVDLSEVRPRGEPISQSRNRGSVPLFTEVSELAESVVVGRARS